MHFTVTWIELDEVGVMKWNTGNINGRSASICTTTLLPNAALVHAPVLLPLVSDWYAVQAVFWIWMPASAVVMALPTVLFALVVLR